ncbi:hypothetical protein ES705_25573 [subsurface metagenome]
MDEGRFVLGDKPFFLYSGEVHYFRIPRKEWRDRLRKAKATGLNTISSYIPWSWHELKEGSFDFIGKTHPERNLLDFIKLLQNSKNHNNTKEYIADGRSITHTEKLKALVIHMENNGDCGI